MSPPNVENDFLAALRKRTQDLIPILSEPADEDVLKYEPFDRPRYTHHDALGSLNAPVWNNIRQMNLADLLKPLGPSLRGEDKFRAWDCSAGVPACRLRTREPRLARQVPNIRKSNPASEKLGEVITHCGPLGTDMSIIRPRDPWIFDLVTHPHGWEIQEQAMALAHWRGEAIQKKDDKHGGAIAQQYVQATAELALAYLLDLPVRVDDRPSYAGYPSLPYGICVATDTERITAPQLKVPVDGPDSPIPDRSLLFVLAAVLVQAPPYGASRGLTEPAVDDRWSASPTMVAFYGFEYVDLVTHAPISIPAPWLSKLQTYTLNAVDLLPMNFLRDHVQICDEWSKLPIPDAVRPSEFANSESIQQIIEACPPRPTRETTVINRNSSTAPASPKKKAKELRSEEKALEQWDNEMTAIYEAKLKATEMYECHGFDLTAKKLWKKERSARRRGYNARKRTLAERRRLIRTLQSEYRQGTVSAAGFKRLRQAKKDMGDDAYRELRREVRRTTKRR